MEYLNPKQKIPVLDGVRAASILLVIMAHALPLGPKVLALNAASGKLGMSLFFCLSGFLVTRILYLDQRIRPFLIRRVLRIAPALYLYLLIIVIVLGQDGVSIAMNALFISNYATSALSQGPVSHLWSLCVEMHFYLTIALVVWLLGRRGLWLVPVAAVIVTGLRVDAGAYANISTHLRVDEILAGGCLALVTVCYAERLREKILSFRVTWALLAAIGPLWFFSGHGAGGDLNYLRPYLAAVLVGVLMHGTLGGVMVLFDNRVTRYIADTSYAVYIYHPLMIAGVMNTGSIWERYLLKRPLSFALTVMAGHLSTFYWERFWQRKAKAWSASSSTSTPNHPGSI